MEEFQYCHMKGLSLCPQQSHARGPCSLLVALTHLRTILYNTFFDIPTSTFYYSAMASEKASTIRKANSLIHSSNETRRRLALTAACIMFAEICPLIARELRQRNHIPDQRLLLAEPTSVADLRLSLDHMSPSIQRTIMLYISKQQKPSKLLFTKFLEKGMSDAAANKLNRERIAQLDFAVTSMNPPHHSTFTSSPPKQASLCGMSDEVKVMILAMLANKDKKVLRATCRQWSVIIAMSCPPPPPVPAAMFACLSTMDFHRRCCSSRRARRGCPMCVRSSLRSQEQGTFMGSRGGQHGMNRTTLREKRLVFD